jgi:xanthine dehydrogenase accessory factor
VVESNRGHNLGRVILDSSAEPNTGVAGTVGGENMRRVLHAPVSGVMHPLCQIGDPVHAGDLVARIDDAPLHSQLDGVVRGLLHTGVHVRAGFKVGDIDPRGVISHCFTISDKALSIGGGAVEAILYLEQKNWLLAQKGGPC